MITGNFSVIYRNFGHWDVNGREGRLFRIRGTPGAFVVLDERIRLTLQTQFCTVSMCMAYIAEQLMYEALISDEESPGNNRPVKTPDSPRL